MSEKPTVKLGSEVVVLDPDLMKFNEQILSKYMEEEAAWYDYYGQKLAQAEYIMQQKELSYDVMYSERFREHKDNGCTEKLSEANSKADPDVQKSKEEYLAAKYNVRLLQQHLRAWDRSHENAQSRGHTLRKEMDKLNSGVYRSDNYLERQLDQVVKEVNPEDVKELLN